MWVEPGVVDANILVYAVNPDTPQHAASYALLARPEILRLPYTLRPRSSASFTQSLRTDTGLPPTSPADAVVIISDLLAQPGLYILLAPEQAVIGLLELLKRSNVTGSDVFDLQIVATMQANNIQRIYTFDASDFQKFSEVTVVIP